MPQNEKFSDTVSEMAVAPSTTVNIDGVTAIKLFPFWKDGSALWFARAEAQFCTYKVSSDTGRFDGIVSELDQDVLAQLADIVENPPTSVSTLLLKII